MKTKWKKLAGGLLVIAAIYSFRKSFGSADATEKSVEKQIPVRQQEKLHRWREKFFRQNLAFQRHSRQRGSDPPGDV